MSREAFEKWVKEEFYYTPINSETLWEVWQAAQAQAVNQQLLEAIKIAIECLGLHGDGFADLGAMTVLQDFVAAIAAAQEQSK